MINKAEKEVSNLGITIAHMPQGGYFKVYLNGNLILFSDKETISSNDSIRTYLRNHISAPASFKSGENEIEIEFDDEPGKVIGIDFFWIKER